MWHPPYLCELINKKESHIITRLGTDHHQLIMPPISKNCSNTFIERSFTYDVPCEWNTLSECTRTSNLIVSGRVLKQCYLHNNMDVHCKCIYVLLPIAICQIFLASPRKRHIHVT